MGILLETDLENDLCYIGLDSNLEPGAVAQTIQVTDDIALDFDATGRLLGIDIINASAVLPASLEGASIDTLVGTKEAASLAGVRPSNFVRDFANRADFPKPTAELATGRVWRKSEVADYLARRKQKAAS
jgi:uncharacterized protein YuzE